MSLKIIIFALLSSAVVSAFPQESPLGQFDGDADVGGPKLAGSASYDAAAQEYTLTGAGSNMWFAQDQ